MLHVAEVEDANLDSGAVWEGDETTDVNLYYDDFAQFKSAVFLDYQCKCRNEYPAGDINKDVCIEMALDGKGNTEPLWWDIFSTQEVPPFGKCVDATYASIPIGKYINRKACFESCRYGGHSSSAHVWGECKCGAQEMPSENIDCSVDAECNSFDNHVCLLGTNTGD